MTYGALALGLACVEASVNAAAAASHASHPLQGAFISLLVVLPEFNSSSWTTGECHDTCMHV
jgi:hypothetical protein